MENLEELLARKIVAEPRRWNRSTITVLSAAATRLSSDVPLVYEDEVFNFLLGNAKALAIAKVLRFKALLVDGAVELADGQRLAVEIKYKMNWRKACQAEWQFRNFLKRPEAAQGPQGPVVGGLVFFNAFNEDWANKPASRVLQNGWNYWYEGHSDVEGLALHLVRFSSGEMEVFPKAL